MSSRNKNKLIKYEKDFTQNKLDEFVTMCEALTPAELLVFKLYVKGFKLNEVANELSLSINTIKYHNRNIFSKLGVHSRKEMLFYIKKMQINR